MFAIFKSGKQASEQVSTMEIASELLKRHQQAEVSQKFEVRAKVKKINKAGEQAKTKAGRDSYQWISIGEFNKRLGDSGNDLFAQHDT